MNELAWIAEARKHIGLKENTSRTKHNPVIVDWLIELGTYNGENRAWWANDEVPWCGTFVGHCLGESGRYVIKEWYRARNWESESMNKLDRPAYGCIVTFTRDGGGHIGFVVGKDRYGNLMVLGGNQSNAVSILPFSRERVTGYYWPSIWRDNQVVKSMPHKSRDLLPLLDSNGKLSTNEA